MQKGILLSIVLLIGFFTVMPSAQAQYFRFDNLQNEPDPEATAQLEVEAILKMFGSLVGSGLYHTADLHDVGGLDVGIRGVLTSVPDEFKDLPVFVDESRIGLAFLHGSIGLPANLELFGRFFYLPLGADANQNLTPPRAADSRGGVTLIGGGLKYGLLQQTGIPKIMLMGTYHALFVPEEFDFGTVGTFSANAVVSHSLPILSLYAAVGVDITSLKVADDSPLLPGERFTENAFKYTVGTKVSVLPFIHLTGALNFGKFNSVDLGLGFSFR